MSAGDKPRTIVSADARPPATLVLEWSDGTRATLDLKEHQRGKAFRPLREAAEFSGARVGEWGHSVEWPSGAELSAETLWLATLSATGHGDTRAFLEWR